MELVITSPNENEFLKDIEFNHEEIKKELALRMVKYEGLVYSEADMKEARADRATLNKFKAAIEAKRKEVKKQCLAPYEAFEEKIRDILSLIEQPILAIDGQVKAFEDKQKDEKKGIIESFYSANIGDLLEILPLNRIWDERWLNATYKMPAIEFEINTAIEKTKSDLVVLGELKSEFDSTIKGVYLATLDLSKALQEKTKLENQKARLEEYQRKQEEAKKIEQPAPEEEIKIETPKTFMEEIGDHQPQLEVIDFRCWVTPEQKNLLKEFFLTNKIKIGRVV